MYKGVSCKQTKIFCDWCDVSCRRSACQSHKLGGEFDNCRFGGNDFI